VATAPCPTICKSEYGTPDGWSTGRFASRRDTFAIVASRRMPLPCAAAVGTPTIGNGCVEGSRSPVEVGAADHRRWGPVV
jgi:hypothetical protein